MNMAISVALFCVFVANVSMGAFGGGSFLGDVPEMLLMATSALFFVAGILVREAKAKNNNND
ncbi:hypothetical protein [Oceanibium sediminis]|uniref:hypothetical protein n=1 Tax=Oceanibium sediminis TaxID=2026339 RepID=UPI000DD4E809|nr:hypothetical protein [Oceanibium sediminis]